VGRFSHSQILTSLHPYILTCPDHHQNNTDVEACTLVDPPRACAAYRLNRINAAENQIPPPAPRSKCWSRTCWPLSNTLAVSRNALKPTLPKLSGEVIGTRSSADAPTSVSPTAEPALKPRRLSVPPRS